MATGTLTLAPDLLDSWLFRQLRPASAPLPKALSEVVAKTVQEDRAAPVVELTVEQEAQILAHVAHEFRADFEPVLDKLNNIHGRCFDDVAEAFQQRLNGLEVALQHNDLESARAGANRLALVVDEMQANIPAWHYVRGLQMLVRRCSKLGL